MSRSLLFPLLMLLSALITAVSQILLKRSANAAHKNALREILNARVMIAYALFAFVLLLNVYIYTGVDYRFGVVMNAGSGLLVALLSVLLLRESMTRRRIVGHLLILAGILVFSLF